MTAAQQPRSLPAICSMSSSRCWLEHDSSALTYYWHCMHHCSQLMACTRQTHASLRLNGCRYVRQCSLTAALLHLP